MVKIIALFHIFYKAKNKTVNKFSYSTYLIQFRIKTLTLFRLKYMRLWLYLVVCEYT